MGAVDNPASSPRRWLRRAVSVATACLIAGAFPLLEALPAQPASATETAGAESKDSSAADAKQGDDQSGATLPDQFGSCVASGGHADIIMLMDESGSLKDTDSDNARVSAGLHLVNQLAKHASDSDLNVQLTSFGHSYSVLQDWTSLGKPAGVKGLRSSMNDLADRTDGVDTDYWTALDSARQELAKVASKRGAKESSCQTIVFFSDGELDIEVRKSKSANDEYGSKKPYAEKADLGSEKGVRQAEKAAEKDLCRPGGLADQLRSSKVALFGVGLGGEGTDPKTFDLMRSIVTGTTEDKASTCGDLIKPVPGEFYAANDIDSLLLAFDSISGIGGDPLRQEKGVCVDKACSDEAHEFVLDKSTPNVDVLATAHADGMKAALIGPDGKTLDLKSGDASGTLKVGSVAVEYKWDSARTVSVSINGEGGNPKDWSGQWQFAFVTTDKDLADTTTSSNIHITPDLRPVWKGLDKAELHRGETVDPVEFSLTNGKGDTVDPQSLAGSIRYKVTSTDAEGAQSTLFETDDKKAISKPTSWDLSKTAIGDGTVELSAELTTAGTKDKDDKKVKGTKLAPVVVTQKISILPPLSYPTVPGTVDFGDVEGPVDLSTTLTLEGKGCAWVPKGGTSIKAAPEGLESSEVTTGKAVSEDSCAEGDITVNLKNDNQGNGTINGTFLVTIASADGNGDPVEVPVNFTANIIKPLDTFNFVTAVLTAIILGVGIPVGLLYLQKWLTSVIPPRPLLAVRTPVTIEDDQVLRDGRRFEFTDGDSRNLVAVGAKGARRITAAGVELEVHLGASPLGRGYVAVDAPLSMSGADPAVPARLPLDVHNNWVIIKHAGTPAGQAELLVLISGTADQRTRERLADEINSRAGECERRLREAAGGEPAFAGSGGGGQQSADSAQDPFGSSVQDPWSNPGDKKNDDPWGEL